MKTLPTIALLVLALSGCSSEDPQDPVVDTGDAIAAYQETVDDVLDIDTDDIESLLADERLADPNISDADLAEVVASLRGLVPVDRIDESGLLTPTEQSAYYLSVLSLPLFAASADGEVSVEVDETLVAQEDGLQIPGEAITVLVDGEEVEVETALTSSGGVTMVSDDGWKIKAEPVAPYSTN